MTTSISGKPAPLQAHASQEQSPVIENEGKVDDGKIAKPLNVMPPAAAVKVPKPAVSKAKRGLKRL
jgi:hypothetical protein